MNWCTQIEGLWPGFRSVIGFLSHPSAETTIWIGIVNSENNNKNKEVKKIEKSDHGAVLHKKQKQYCI